MGILFSKVPFDLSTVIENFLSGIRYVVTYIDTLVKQVLFPASIQKDDNGSK